MNSLRRMRFLRASFGLESSDWTNMPAARVADYLTAISSCEFTFAFTLGADLGRFRVYHRPPVENMVLYVEFDQLLTFPSSICLSDRAGYFLRFFVLKLDDELPLGTNRTLAHACILYESCE
jgi:hypothetical protein